jgi:hypothetical protein
MSEHGDQDSDASASALVDESLIDAMMALTPAERLKQNDRMVRTIAMVKQAVAESTSGQDAPDR